MPGRREPKLAGRAGDAMSQGPPVEYRRVAIVVALMRIGDVNYGGADRLLSEAGTARLDRVLLSGGRGLR